MILLFVKYKLTTGENVFVFYRVSRDARENGDLSWVTCPHLAPPLLRYERYLGSDLAQEFSFSIVAVYSTMRFLIRNMNS